MTDVDKKYVDEIRAAFGFGYHEQQLGLKDIKRLLAIIERIEAECQIREYQKNAWQRESASLKAENAKLMTSEIKSSESEIRCLDKITMNAREINRAARNIIDRLDDERTKQHYTILNYIEEVKYLKAQLLAIKKVGEPLVRVYKDYATEKDDKIGLQIIEPMCDDTDFTVGELRRLVEKLDEVEDG